MNCIKKLNIAMLGHKRIPSREGGVEIVVEELSKRMANLGHTVTCYNRGGHHVCGKQFDTEFANNHKGIILKSVFTINKKGLAAVTSSVMASVLLLFRNTDIVHFHAEGPCVALWIPKLFGKKCIATIHGIDWKREKWGPFARCYIKLGEYIAAKYADEIIVLSKNLQSYFWEKYRRETVYIPNGVSKPKQIPCNCIKREFSLKKDSYILFLGRLVPEKGLSYLIDAYKKVKTDKKLVIAGGSSDSEEYVEMLKKKAENDKRIIFTGFVQGRILEELYSNAYLYVLPSDLEGMPLSLLEALSYGNCCLVSDIPECTEVVENNALIFKRADIEDLAIKLDLACSDKVLVNKYKSRSTQFVCNKYNWDDIVNETLSIYERILKS